MRTLFVISLVLLFNTPTHAASLCDEPLRNREICLGMQHMKAQIHALDAQRELMQVNPSYLGNLGRTLSETAHELVRKFGPSIPEHLRGLNGVDRLGQDLASKAAKNDSDMMRVANTIRMNCATCHTADAGNSHQPRWDQVFGSDWGKIATHCSEAGQNPYLCRSMNGMLSAYGYLLTSYQFNARDFGMTSQASREIIRILEDVQAKNFTHLPEDLRKEALAAAKEVNLLASARDPMAFEKGVGVVNACLKCHEQEFGPSDPSDPSPNRAWNRPSSVPFVRSH